jgi:threonine dehydratase
VRQTPTLTVPLAALTGDKRDDPGPEVVLKLEQLQCAGSFKARGAFANLLLREVPAAGVVAASGGNHGVAVAYAAHQLGIPATIFIPVIGVRPALLGAQGRRPGPLWFQIINTPAPSWRSR